MYSRHHGLQDLLRMGPCLPLQLSDHLPPPTSPCTANFSHNVLLSVSRTFSCFWSFTRTVPSVRIIFSSSFPHSPSYLPSFLPCFNLDVSSCWKFSLSVQTCFPAGASSPVWLLLLLNGDHPINLCVPS